jgi:putative PIN family toxin of toxin-antitoxin system
VTRAVVDTNVLVSGVIALHGAPRRILEAWHAGQFTLVTSEAIIAEVARVLRYPRIRDRYNLAEDDVKTVVDSLKADTEVVAGLYEVRRSADPADDMFLACAGRHAPAVCGHAGCGGRSAGRVADCRSASAGAGEQRGQGDKGTRGQGDKGTG